MGRGKAVVAGSGWARSVQVGRVKAVGVRRGLVGQGGAGQGGPGRAGSGLFRWGESRRSRFVKVRRSRRGGAWSGWVWRSGRGLVRHGGVR